MDTTPQLRHSVLGPGLALVLFGGFSAACTSGGTRTAPIGPRTETISVRVGGAAGGALEVGTEASVMDTTVSAAPDAIWSALPTVFQLLRIETSTVDAGSLMIGNQGFVASRIGGRSLSTYLDCGQTFGGPTADRYEVTLYLMVELAGSPGGGTLVRTVTDAYARPRGVSGNSLHCVSKGTLERRILELVTQIAPGAIP